MARRSPPRRRITGGTPPTQFDRGTHHPQRFGDALHRSPPQTGVSVKRARRPARERAHQQPHHRSGVGTLDCAGVARELAPATRTKDVSSCTSMPSARNARIVVTSSPRLLPRSWSCLGHMPRTEVRDAKSTYRPERALRKRSMSAGQIAAWSSDADARQRRRLYTSVVQCPTEVARANNGRFRSISAWDRRSTARTAKNDERASPKGHRSSLLPLPSQV